MVIPQITASVPPESTTSARPSRIIRAAFAIASAPDAHALTGECTPARAPISKPTTAAGPLGMIIVTMCGETRDHPRSFNVS